MIQLFWKPTKIVNTATFVNVIIYGCIYISAMDECFLSFKFNCSSKKEKLSKAGSDSIKSMIDSSKVCDDGKHVELQQILDTSQDPAVWVYRNFVSTYCSIKSLAKVNLAKRGMFHFMILIIYTISLGVNKKTKKSIKVGAVKVYDTNLIYSRVIGHQASDRPVDIADLLAHELAPVPPALFTDSGELKTASAKSVLKTNTAQLLSARRVQENVDVIVIDGSAYLWIPSCAASGTIQHYTEKFKYHIGQKLTKADVFLHLTDTKNTALREPLEHQEALV